MLDKVLDLIMYNKNELKNLIIYLDYTKDGTYKVYLRSNVSTDVDYYLCEFKWLSISDISDEMKTTINTDTIFEFIPKRFIQFIDSKINEEYFKELSEKLDNKFEIYDVDPENMCTYVYNYIFTLISFKILLSHYESTNADKYTKLIKYHNIYFYYNLVNYRRECDLKNLLLSFISYYNFYEPILI